MNLIHFLSRSLTTAVAATVVLINPPLAAASDQGPVYSFDFTDSYYRANGIDPSKVMARPTGLDGRSVVDNSNTNPTRRNIRDQHILVTYDHSGQLWFFHSLALLSRESFTHDAAGAQAYQLAEKYNLYAFPRKGNPGGEVFPKRQEDLSDLRDGYFSNNPLGLWKVSLVRYTDTAFNTPAGQDELAELATRNGTDVDGTPIIRTMGDLDSLRGAGYVTVTPVSPDEPGGVPWFVCPIIKDPRNGAIAPDSFLSVVTRTEDGSLIPESARILNEFNCLRNTGNACN